MYFHLRSKEVLARHIIAEQHRISIAAIEAIAAQEASALERKVLRRSSRSMLRSARIPPIAATTCGCGLAEIFPLHMRGLGIGISVFFGWTTNEILALFFRHASRKSASPGRSSCRRRRGGACVRVQGARNAGRSLDALEEGVTTGEIYIGMR
ncbi:TetR family transcriptional regulator [Rhodococcus wratislaviensis IFP 2016]|nr:TetR family transcriptional regulator [Rhodococcus wratislaviensis IFP 2016]